MLSRKSFSFVYTIFISLAVIFVFYLLSFVFSYSSSSLSYYCLAVAFIYFILLSFCLGLFVARWGSFADIKNFSLHLSFVIITLGLALLGELVKFSFFPAITIIIILISITYLLGAALLFIVPYLVRKKEAVSALKKEAALLEDKKTESNLETEKKRRGFRRYYDNIKIKCCIRQREWECFSHDVSATGMRIISKEEINIDEIIKVEVLLSGDSRPIYIKARVIWSQPVMQSDDDLLYYAGIKFIKIETADKIRLISKYIFESFR